jgi:hypothetical protein
VQYRIGTRLYSATSTVEVIVTRVSDADVEIVCHGAPMLESQDGRELDGDGGPADVPVGKRFADAAGTIELLCVKAGAGPLSVDGEDLAMREAKPLPSSD